MPVGKQLHDDTTTMSRNLVQKRPGIRLSSGKHLDPLTAPAPSELQWSGRERFARSSRAMDHFRQALVAPSKIGDPREGILDDLSTFYGISEQECIERCLNWEEYSLKEWYAETREHPDEIVAFYNSVHSWSFDLLWFAYLQSSGLAYPVSVVALESLKRPSRGRHLDFGSGVGVTSQVFAASGYVITLADISTPLLDFARFRLERRGIHATYLNLNHDELPRDAFDVVTAIDTLVHVPDVATTSAQLHAAMLPESSLFANFDVRPKTYENGWHLYDDDLPLRWKLHRAGFEPEESLDGMLTHYRRVEPSGLGFTAAGARDIVTLRSPLRPAMRKVRRGIRFNR